MRDLKPCANPFCQNYTRGITCNNADCEKIKIAFNNMPMECRAIIYEMRDWVLRRIVEKLPR